MKRIVWFFMTTLTVVVLLFGYHTSTSSRAAGGETAFVSTVQPGSATSSSIATTPTTASTTETATTETTATTATTKKATAAVPHTPSAAGTTTAAPKTPTSSASATTAPATPTPSTSTAASAPSTVTGDVTDTRWGPVQVQLTLTSGKITAVSVLQYPNGNGKDSEINSYALPILIQETISAQSAKIDMVSGATVTSGGYLGSLQSALDKM